MKNKNTIIIILLVVIIIILGYVAFLKPKNVNVNEKVNNVVKNNDIEKLIISTTKEKCLSEAKVLFPAFINKNNDLLNYTVNNINFFALNDNQGGQYFPANVTSNACMVSVNYSVEPKPAAYFDWSAGNGHPSNGWILNKGGFMTIDKNNNGYYVVGMGTGY